MARDTETAMLHVTDVRGTLAPYLQRDLDPYRAALETAQLSVATAIAQRGTLAAPSYAYLLGQDAKEWLARVGEHVAREQVRDDDERVGVLLRAIYIHLDPLRYERWLARADDGDRRVVEAVDSGAPLGDYMDDVDATFGNGVSSRWVQELLPYVSFRDAADLTIGDRETIRELAARLATAIGTQRVAPIIATPLHPLYAGGADRRRASQGTA